MKPTRVTWLVESMFALDGGAMFGIIPKPLWEKKTAADDKNRISLACRTLLVQYEDGKNVLADVGMGSKWTEKERAIYRIADQDHALETALAQHGLTPSQITDVVLTHLHLDHAGGLCRFDENQNTVANFPNATHWVQRENWNWGNAPSERDIGSYRPVDFQFLDRDDAPTLNLIDGATEILPGIEVRPQNGHTFGMQIVVVTTQSGERYAHLADLIPTSAHIGLPYIMGYDLQPLVTLQEKKEVLHAAAEHDWILVFEHDPSLAAARVSMKNDRASLTPVEG